MRYTICAGLLLMAPGGAGGAQPDHAQHRRLLLTIQSNAEEARYNAGIYQWARVNRETDRIVAAAKRLAPAFSSHADWEPQRDALAKAIGSLRAARLHRRSGELQEAARRLATLAGELAREEGAPDRK